MPDELKPEATNIRELKEITVKGLRIREFVRDLFRTLRSRLSLFSTVIPVLISFFPSQTVTWLFF